VLRYAAGATATAIARDLHITKHTVGKWRGRFVARRLDGLLDEPRPSVPRTNADAYVERALTATLESTPRNATHWSTRSLAQHSDVSQTAIARIWKALALQPHRVLQRAMAPLVLPCVIRPNGRRPGQHTPTTREASRKTC
jgi:transposase